MALTPEHAILKRVNYHTNIDEDDCVCCRQKLDMHPTCHFGREQRTLVLPAVSGMTTCWFGGKTPRTINASKYTYIVLVYDVSVIRETYFSHSYSGQ